MNPMKDSGVEWIGEIPRDWKISKIKYTTKLNGRIGWQGLTSNEYQDEGPFLITGTDFKDGRINFDSAVHIEESRWAEAKQIQVENGDLLITKDGTVGKVAIIEDLDGKASLNSGVLRIQTTDELNRKYLYYVLLSEEFWLWFNYTNSGASTILHLYQNVFERFTYAVPPLQEQQAIADFLDEETKKLDDAKDLLQKQIEKLKEYRKSLIWETVTKGLDKSVPMKDSGVEWIGKIPESWKLKKIKYVSSSDDEQVKTQDISFGKTIRYVDIGTVNLTEGITGYQEMSLLDAPSRARKIVRIGDTIVSTVRTYLKAIAYIQDEENVVVSTGFSVLRPKKVDKKFFNYCIISDSFTKQVENVAWGIAYPSISNSNLVNLKISYPADVSEQQAIADFLDEKTAIIEKVISNILSQIVNIDKQKKTLIYDYVTGKRRVI